MKLCNFRTDIIGSGYEYAERGGIAPLSLLFSHEARIYGKYRIKILFCDAVK